MNRLFLSAGLVCASWIALALVDLAPPTTGAVAVVVSPFGTRQAVDVIAAAGGRLLRLGPWPWIAVGIKSVNEDFGPTLRAAGAWLVLSPIAAGDCHHAAD
jgi:hypothetical protein